MQSSGFDRRRLLASAAVAGAALALPQLAGAAGRKADMVAIRQAAEAGKADSIARLQEWIRHPGIAAGKMARR